MKSFYANEISATTYALRDLLAAGGAIEGQGKVPTLATVCGVDGRVIRKCCA